MLLFCSVCLFIVFLFIWLQFGELKMNIVMAMTKPLDEAAVDGCSGLQDNSTPTNQLAVSQVTDWICSGYETG